MFTAYFDASGTKRSEVMAIGGFVAPVDKWEQFEKAWKKLLPPSIPLFRMTNFVSSKEGWEEWKGKSARRAWFIDSLVKCIRAHTRRGFVVSMALNDYNAANASNVFSREAGGAYQLLGIAGLGQLKEWAAKKKIDYRGILCIFEDGDEGGGDLIARARAEGFNAIPQSKKHIRAFDACDLAAWKSKTITDDAHVKRLHRSDARSAERILKALDQLEVIAPNAGRLSAKALTKTVEQLRARQNSA
jgi:hypothetical protein